MAAVIAVAACGPREDRLATDPDSVVNRMASGADTRSNSSSSRPAPAAAPADTARMGAAPAPAAAPATDAQITAQVRAALVAAQDLRGARIDVDTSDGVVTLSGTVPSAGIKARATEIAKGSRDVRSVNDQLTLAAG